jgi:aminopeptidase N
VSVTGNESLQRFRFERTPIMSTYLLAFVIGEYDYIEEKDRNGVLIRVYTPLGKKEQGRFALDVLFFFSFNYIIIHVVGILRFFNDLTVF